MEGVIPGELWTRQGSAAAATLIGSIAQTNTCRITRPSPPVHIHTSGRAAPFCQESKENAEEGEEQNEEGR